MYVRIKSNAIKRRRFIGDMSPLSKTKVCNIKLDFAEQNKLLNVRKVGPQSCRIAVKYFLCFNIAPCKLAQSETISQRFFIPTRKYLLYVNRSSKNAPCFDKINIGFIRFIGMTLRGLKFQSNCFLL